MKEIRLINQCVKIKIAIDTCGDDVAQTSTVEYTNGY